MATVTRINPFATVTPNPTWYQKLQVALDRFFDRLYIR